jgi:hypothetical protein
MATEAVQIVHLKSKYKVNQIRQIIVNYETSDYCKSVEVEVIALLSRFVLSKTRSMYSLVNIEIGSIRLRVCIQLLKFGYILRKVLPFSLCAFFNWNRYGSER